MLCRVKTTIEQIDIATQSTLPADKNIQTAMCVCRKRTASDAAYIVDCFAQAASR